MPKYLNEDLRRKLVGQATEIYFPLETEEMVEKTMAELFKSYCEKAYGPVPPFANRDCTYSIELGPDIPPVTFSSFWLRAPFLQPKSISYSVTMNVDPAICPVPGLIDSAKALASFRASRQKFSDALSGELLKYATVETFLRRFPALEGAFIQVIGEKSAIDLPVECDVDINSIVDMISL